MLKFDQKTGRLLFIGEDGKMRVIGERDKPFLVLTEAEVKRVFVEMQKGGKQSAEFECPDS